MVDKLSAISKEERRGEKMQAMLLDKLRHAKKSAKLISKCAIFGSLIGEMYEQNAELTCFFELDNTIYISSSN